MSKKEILLDFIENHNGMITYRDCKKLGIPTIYPTRLELDIATASAPVLTFDISTTTVKDFMANATFDVLKQ